MSSYDPLLPLCSTDVFLASGNLANKFCRVLVR
jgi:hypothetical protein